MSEIIKKILECGIIDSGIKDGWYYRKYGDGRYEAEKVVSQTTGAMTISAGIYVWSGTYPATPTDMINPVITGAITNDGSNSQGGWLISNPSGFQVAKAGGGGSTANAITVMIRFTAIGRWK